MNPVCKILSSALYLQGDEKLCKLHVAALSQMLFTCVCQLPDPSVLPSAAVLVWKGNQRWRSPLTTGKGPVVEREHQGK